MTWIFEHTEVITLIATIAVPILILGGMTILAGGDTPEASDLQGFPETLGDFPPFSQDEIARIRELGQADMRQIREQENYER